jgi:hypothetical protein
MEVLSGKSAFPGFELKLLIVAGFLVNDYFFLVRNISGCRVKLTVGLSSLTLYSTNMNPRYADTRF